MVYIMTALVLSILDDLENSLCLKQYRSNTVVIHK